MSREKSSLAGRLLGAAAIAGAAALGWYLAKKANEQMKRGIEDEFLENPDPFGDLEDEDSADYADEDLENEPIFSFTVSKGTVPKADTAEDASASGADADEEPAAVVAEEAAATDETPTAEATEE